jgi:hypothetical protein
MASVTANIFGAVRDSFSNTETSERHKLLRDVGGDDPETRLCRAEALRICHWVNKQAKRLAKTQGQEISEKYAPFQIKQQDE